MNKQYTCLGMMSGTSGDGVDASIIRSNGLDKLTKFNNFTSTSPAFRCNLEISSDKGGFSSYQSEYPFNMINKNLLLLFTTSNSARLCP